MSRLFALEGSTDEARGALALDLKVQAPPGPSGLVGHPPPTARLETKQAPRDFQVSSLWAVRALAPAEAEGSRTRIWP